MIDSQMEIKAKIDGVADIGQYQKSEISTFERVMAQINIAGHSDFEKQLTQYWRDVTGENELLSVLICEIDFYDEYVDNYGVQGASFMLLVVALALKNICEQHGFFLARYKQGGFAILIKGGDEHSVLAISERLCKAVEASRTEHKYSQSSNIVTLRVGISATYPESMATLKSKADKALQNAKILGRNQVSNDSRKMAAVVTEIEAQVAASVTERETDKEDLFAPNKDENAPNRDAAGFPCDPLKETIKKMKIEKKPPAVRMYRGYAIDS